MPAPTKNMPRVAWMYFLAFEYTRTIKLVEKATAYRPCMMIDNRVAPVTIAPATHMGASGASPRVIIATQVNAAFGLVICIK